MSDESNATPKKPKIRLVARTTYRMDRGRLKRFVRWVRVSATEAEECPETPPPASRPKPEPRPEPRVEPRPEPRPEPRVEPLPSPWSEAPQPSPEVRHTEARPQPVAREESQRRPRDDDRRPSRPPHRSGWQDPPEVTVVLRTFNCEANLEPLLDLTKAQETPFRFDILAVDGRSQDRSLDILSRQGIPVLSIALEDRFIDRAMDRASGKVAVFINDRMLPRSPTWLADICRPILTDPQVAIVTGRQIPGDDRSAYERVTVMTNPNLAGLRPMVYSRGDDSPGATFLPVFNTALSREAWKALPLGDASTSEWTAAVLGAGYRKLYLPGAAVELGGGARINRLLVENYRRGREADRPLPEVIGSWARQVWSEWRTLNESGLVESGRRGEAYWQALVVKTATLAGALERQKLVRGLTQRLLK
ncbi:MAG: glycosyltransferase family A protein [Pseudomonadota bacterium]